MSRIIMLVDLDYFYARIEENRNPLLKGKPVVVGVYSGRTATSGSVATCNYEARRYGVRSGMPLFRARDLLKNVPETVFVPGDFDLYETVSNRIVSILREYADVSEQVSVDEAFLDVTKKCNEDYELAKALAKQIKKEILEKENISCSVGIGPNKVVAKMASKLQKPDGLSVVRPDDFKTVFWLRPVKDLYGIGPKTVEKLEEIGVQTIGDLAQSELDDLQGLFGQKLGKYFHDAANGIDEEPVEEKEQKQFGRIVTLKRNSRNVEDFAETLDLLSQDVAATAARNGFEFKNVGIFAVMEDLENLSRSRTLNDFTADPKIVASVSRELYQKLIDDTEKSIRRAGVRVATLRKKGSGLQQFFSKSDGGL